MKLAVVCDLREENWPSMELSADELIRHAGALRDLSVTRIQPAALYPPLAARRTRLGLSRQVSNAALAFERYLHYPTRLLARRHDFDCYHVVDHSYAHLLFALPAERSGVYCHDIDAFRAALPGPGRRPGWRSTLAKLLLAGLRRASVVFYSTAAVRADIEQHQLVVPERLIQAPFGVAPEFVAAAPEGEVELPLPARYVLHVGTLIPRKNPAFLLELFTALAQTMPDLELVQVGGDFTAAQRTLLEARGLLPRVSQLRDLSRAQLAQIYRRSALVLLPSLAEGFGFPAIEALACGAVVLASDLPSLRQVGGNAVVFRPTGSLVDWTETALRLLAGEDRPDRQARLNQSRRYSWTQHAQIIVEAYRRQIANRG